MGLKHGRCRHLERESGDEWVSACRNVEVVGRREDAEAGRLGESV